MSSTFIRYNWTILLPAELSAASVLISFWDKSTNPAVWVTVFIVVVVCINMLGAGEFAMIRLVRFYKPSCDPPGAYGEAEFIFS